MNSDLMRFHLTCPSNGAEQLSCDYMALEQTSEPLCDGCYGRWRTSSAQEMDAIMKRAVEMCFEDDTVRFVVLGVLRIHQEHKLKAFPPKVSPLEVLVIKSIMARKLKEDVYGLVIYSLVFGEVIHLYNFKESDRTLWYDDVFLRREMTGDAHKVFPQLRSDPEVMLAVLGQHLDRFKTHRIHIRMERNGFRVKVNEMIIAAIRHPDGEKFCTQCASKFARLIFRKGVRLVFLELRGEENCDLEFIEDLLERMIADLKPVIPSEGWKEAVENGNRPIYGRLQTFVADRRVYKTVFSCNTEFSPYVSYWGYVL